MTKSQMLIALDDAIVGFKIARNNADTTHEEDTYDLCMNDLIKVRKMLRKMRMPVKS